jgi:hypothetical protein
MLIIDFIGEFLKLFGAVIVWVFQRLIGNRKTFKAYVWEEEIPLDKWQLILVGFSFLSFVVFILFKVI